MIVLELWKLGEQVPKNWPPITRTQEEFLVFFSLHTMFWSRGTETRKEWKGLVQEETFPYPAGPQNRRRWVVCCVG